MMAVQDNFGAFVDEDEELFVLPDGAKPREAYQIGSAPMPFWFMEEVNRQRVVLTYEGCNVLVRGRYLHAPVGFYVVKMESFLSIESPEQNQ